jgi:indole-3-glycerol phosphate synthase
VENNTNILDEIVKTKRSEVEALKAARPLESLLKEAETMRIVKRPFRALFETGPMIIAEIKPRSPSAGELIAGSPLEIADLYAKSEANVISVLTDAKYFGGSNELLKKVRARVPQTILRKDFIIDEYQVCETFLLPADAYLLIASVLTEQELSKFIRLGASLGIEALVEVRDEQDIEKAVRAGAKILGINNRDLATFETDISVTEKLMKKIPKGLVVISESGIETPDDVRRVRKSGIKGILVGTSVLQSSDPVKKIRELKNAMYV